MPLPIRSQPVHRRHGQPMLSLIVAIASHQHHEDKVHPHCLIIRQRIKQLRFITAVRQRQRSNICHESATSAIFICDNRGIVVHFAAASHTRLRSTSPSFTILVVPAARPEASHSNALHFDRRFGTTLQRSARVLDDQHTRSTTRVTFFSKTTVDALAFDETSLFRIFPNTLCYPFISRLDIICRQTDGLYYAKAFSYRFCGEYSYPG